VILLCSVPVIDEERVRNLLITSSFTLSDMLEITIAHGVDVNQSVSSDHKTALDVITHERRCANNNEIALTIVYLVFHGAKGVRGDIYELWNVEPCATWI